jgi:hypothetical protein
VRWLAQARGASPEEMQRRYVLLRLQFNVALTQFDLFADVITQRSEASTGVWLSGLDVAAMDALALPGAPFQAPPLICYLDRGPGGAIRRAHTRLPDGTSNPVAIIRVPRERMVGSGIASSLVHEVGHQGAALLDLVASLRPLLLGLQQQGGAEARAWSCWERWISEIVADFWAVARVGVASTLGLMGIVSLPSHFQFRVSLDDPHPTPWVRVQLSAALGEALYPSPQWRNLAALWWRLYPLERANAADGALIASLLRTLPALTALLLHHRPRALAGRSLADLLRDRERHPRRLAETYVRWQRAPREMKRAAPSLAFAVLGQARADGVLSAAEESHALRKLLTLWALRSSLEGAERCAARPSSTLTFAA